MNRYACAALAAVAAASLALPGAVLAQAFPSKPLRMVVPFPPGGIDTQARFLAQKMAEDLGQPVLVENRSGANGNIGTEAVARSAPDGHTMVFTSSSTMVIGLMLSKARPFDAFKDFTPIANVYESVQALAVSADLPVNSVQELVEYARRNPGKLSFSSSGIGSWVHLAGEVFKQATGTDIVHVPYKGTGPMTADVAAGRVQLTFPSLATAASFLGAGKVKLLALAETRRYAGMASVPTIIEHFPEFRKPPSWIALFGPAEVPRPVVQRLNGAVVKALDAPDTRAFFAKRNALIVGSTPEEMVATLKRDWESTAKLIATLGLQPE